MEGIRMTLSSSKFYGNFGSGKSYIIHQKSVLAQEEEEEEEEEEEGGYVIPATSG
jgi:hypothetical protein